MSHNNIVSICKQNAYLYSEKICNTLEKYNNIFPEFFDWSDHIAADSNDKYTYHLNKIVNDIEKLIVIFKKIIPEVTFEDWKKKWYYQTIAAAWIHDIGLLNTISDADNAHKHSYYSASYLFNNKDGFNFDSIDTNNKIKIALLCIKHNNSWKDTYLKTKTILNEKFYKKLDEYIGNRYKPTNELHFSGQLISMGDCMRYRGCSLKNNLKKNFRIYYKCDKCSTIYSSNSKSCCSKKLEFKKVGVFHSFNNNNNINGLKQLNNKDIDIYKKPVTDYQKLEQFNPNNHSLQNKDAVVLVREDNQLYTRGDISLSNLEVYDIESWYKELEKNMIDYEIIDNIYDNNKTVVQLTLDINNLDAALFTLQTYITEYLDENICSDQEFSDLYENKTILYILINKDVSFSSCFKKIYTYKSNYGMAIKDAITSLTDNFENWNNNKNVLPIELEANKLKIINLEKIKNEI